MKPFATGRESRMPESASRVHTTASVFLAAVSLVAIVASTAAALPGPRPTLYSEFTTVVTPANLETLIGTEDYLYLPDAIYELDNPVVISRTTPLFIHGSNRSSTQLVALNPGLPLFEIQSGGVVNFTNVNLRPTRNFPTQADTRAIVTTNTVALHLELVEVRLGTSVLEITGPGTLRLQGVHIAPGGVTTAPVIIDHPLADALIVGGNCSNNSLAPLVPGNEKYHVWAKRGRLRIYSTGFQGALGEADVRIDEASALGPHVIANVRSEGSNGFPTGLPPTLLTVPPTTEAVDVLMKGNAGAWVTALGASRFADYNGAGTLWMLGNHSSERAEILVSGSAPGATLVAVGNRLEATDPIQATGALEIEAHNLYRDDIDNDVKFVSPGVYFADRPTIPTIPDIPIPPPIARPVADLAMPGMLDVTAYGAVADDALDDLAAIQAALDVPSDGRHVYFPAGTYHVSDAIKYNHATSTVIQSNGGWIAGAGSAQSEIVRIGAGPVFATDGMAYNTIQGLTFRTEAWDSAAPTSDINFAIENVNGVGHASQEIVFHDVVFDGGHTALGIGLGSATQCSENLMVGVEFRNARYGLGVGGYNALANVAYDGSWVDNEINAGHAGLIGGTWAVLGGTAVGTTDRDLDILGTASGVWYLEDYHSDAPTLYDLGWTSAAYPVWFERSTFGIGATSPVSYQFAGVAGPIFLRSSFESAGLDLDLKQSVNGSYALNLYSAIPLWSEADEGASGQIDELQLAIPGVPALGPIALALLAATLTACGGMVIRRRWGGDGHSTHSR